MGPSQVAIFIAGRTFLPGEEAVWIDGVRRRLDELHLRALEADARPGLGIGGMELAAAVRTGRRAHAARAVPTSPATGC
jgi:SARP family transcriptional regulator, regulator of embCAB operon